MDLFKIKRILKSANSLDLIPVRLCGYEEKDGKIILMVPKFQSKWINNLFPVTRLMYYHISLDDTGSEVWRNITDMRNIYDISREVMNKFKNQVPSSDEFQQRIVKFINMLYDRKCISFQQILKK